MAGALSLYLGALGAITAFIDEHKRRALTSVEGLLSIWSWQ